MMMESLRRGATSWVAKGLLSLLVFSFALWGVADVFRGYGMSSLARVGKTEISADEFQQALQIEINNLSNRIGRRLTIEQARAFGIDTRVLSRLVGMAALDTKTRELGLAVPEKAVTEAIRNDPAFKGPDGSFSRPMFNEILRQNGISEGRYFTERRAAATREQLTEALLDSIALPATPVNIIYRYREEQRVIAYATLDPSKAAKIAEPDEAKLREYFDLNKHAFAAPEYRKINVLLLTTEEVKKLVPVSDAEVKEAYERDKEKYNDPEKRRVQQLSFPDMASAEKAWAELSKAKSLDEAIKAKGYKESDIDLGLVARSDFIDKALAEAAFSTEKGKLSKPVQGKFTTAIFRVTEIQPGKVRTFDDVKAQITDKLAIERSGRKIQELRDEVDDERNAGKPLREIADKLKLRFVEIAAADRSGKAPDGKPAFDNADAQRIVGSAFEGDAGLDRDAVELQDGYAWVDVASITPSREKPFEEVQAEVKTQWQEGEKKKALSAAAQAIVERLDKGDKLEAIAKEQGVKVETAKPFKRNDPPAGLTPAGVRQVFSLAKGKAGSSETQDQKSRVVFVVTDIVAAPEPTKEKTEQVASDLSRELQDDALGSYLGALQNRVGVSINEAVLKRTMGADRQ
jgi:peptidyl-prolyl cis-trans isomerase D